MAETKKKIAIGAGLIAAVTGIVLLLKKPPPPTIIYTCPYCGAQFASEEELSAHIQAEHPEQPSYICPYCGQTFWTALELQQHIELEHPVEPPPFEMTFSARIINPPDGTTYWAIEQGMFSVEEVWWYMGPALSPFQLHVVFLNDNYQCPIGDPSCEGKDFDFAPEDGGHYILDCSTGEAPPDPEPPPEPPPPPPVADPELIALNLPSVPSGSEFYPEYTLFLPKIWKGGKPVYEITFSIIDLEYPRASPNNIVSLKALPGTNYYQERGISLINPDDIYQCHGRRILNYQWDSAIAEWRDSFGWWGSRPKEPMKPGIYTVNGKIMASRFLGGVSTSYEYGAPQVFYDLGVVGELTVT